MPTRNPPRTQTSVSTKDHRTQPETDHQIETIARGLLIEQGHLLLCRAVRAGYRYLPGGHVEFGERAGVALEREFIEECGLAVKTRRLALVMEHAFGAGKAGRHEVLLVFHVERTRRRGARVTSADATPPTPPRPPTPIASLEPSIAFDWWPLAALGRAKLRPDPMRLWLQSLAASAPASAPGLWLSPSAWSES